MKRNHTKKASVAYSSGAFGGPRYSNLNPANYKLGGSWNSYGGNAGLTNGSSTSGLGQNTSGSSSGLGQDTSGSGFWDVFPNILNSLTTVATSIWGKNQGIDPNTMTNLYYQEKKTTNMLIGIAVGLVLLAFVILIIKKK